MLPFGMRPSLSVCVLIANLINTVIAHDEESAVPMIHHSNIASVTLFAQNPEIVTPVGIAVAPDGRVFVQENHTHKRETGYQGPEKDRILVFKDTDGDGIADERSIFYEGHTFSTDLLFGPDGHLYVSTRWFIGRFLNAADQDRASGEPEKLIICDTDGDYPHNGVGGMAIDPADPDRLVFGFGENLGVDYTFIGTDGTKISGGGEGGSTYQCRVDGTELVRQSTGHWNAFGMAFDLAGNVFSTDNDPNATPPNRLLHIVPGADFGYEYRYGRSGRHPLVCWYGENPGTLGMIGALGEAACGLVPYGPDRLLSASWTDNRVDVHTLIPEGASFRATREPFLSGSDDFRPVHFAYSKDGRFLYFSDWVKISYPVHGYGRVWRVEFKRPIRQSPLVRDSKTASLSVQEALTLLGDDDPYVRTQAMHALSQQPDALRELNLREVPGGVARAHYAVALKRTDSQAFASSIPVLLRDSDSDVRYVGIKWIADEQLTQYRSDLHALLKRPDLTRRDLRAAVAALARLGQTSKREFSPDNTLFELATDGERPSRLRAIALRDLDHDYERLTVAVLADLAKWPDILIRREAILSLSMHPDPHRSKVLAELANDASLDSALRADAIAGLAAFATEHSDMLGELMQDSDQTVAKEAARTLASAKLIPRALAAKPSADDLEAWKQMVRFSDENADVASGRRLFYHANLGGCYKCHSMAGRGQAIGPDLSTIKNQSGITADWLLKHIVNPNAEMAPYYRPQQLLTVDGVLRTGLVVGREGGKQAYVDSAGEVFFVNKNEIEQRRELTTSIMPTGLLDALTPEEVRDLIAYLLEGE